MKRKEGKKQCLLAKIRFQQLTLIRTEQQHYGFTTINRLYSKKPINHLSLQKEQKQGFSVNIASEGKEQQ